MTTRTNKAPAAQLGLQRVNGRECLTMGETSADFTANLVRFEAVTSEEHAELEATSRSQLAMVYGYDDSAPDAERKPYVFKDGVAVIPIHGTLLNRFNSSWGFVTGYNYVRRMLNAAMADEDVDLIVFDVDSPGGEAAGCFELAYEIMAAREAKPSLAVVDSVSASGGYALACCASAVYAIPSARIGSIGVYRMHMDISKMLEDDGIAITFATAGDHKIDGNMYEPISDEVLNEWRENAGKTWDDFIALVAEARDLPDASVRETQARVYRAEEALDLGLINAVKTTTEAVAAFVAELADDEPSDGEDEMTTKSQQQAAPEATSVLTAADVANQVAAALAADRQRTAAIIGSEEGKTRPKLAQTLATTTSLSVEEARVVLGAAAVETKVGKTKVQADPEDEDDQDTDNGDEDGDDDGEEAAAPKGKQKAKNRQATDTVNHLDVAMQNSRHPNVGSGNEQRQNVDDPTPADQANAILADLAVVTGQKWGDKAAA